MKKRGGSMSGTSRFRNMRRSHKSALHPGNFNKALVCLSGFHPSTWCHPSGPIRGNGSVRCHCRQLGLVLGLPSGHIHFRQTPSSRSSWGHISEHAVPNTADLPLVTMFCSVMKTLIHWYLATAQSVLQIVLANLCKSSKDNVEGTLLSMVELYMLFVSLL